MNKRIAKKKLKKAMMIKEHDPQGFYWGIPDTSLDPGKAFIRHTTGKKNVFVLGQPGGGKGITYNILVKEKK